MPIKEEPLDSFPSIRCQLFPDDSVILEDYTEVLNRVSNAIEGSEEKKDEIGIFCLDRIIYDNGDSNDLQETNEETAMEFTCPFHKHYFNSDLNA